MKLVFNKKSLVFVIAVAVISVLLPNSASAYLTGFDAGRIMDDAIMADNKSMTEAQIQSFLKSKNSCNDTNFSKITGRNETTGWHNFTDKKGIARTAYYNIKDGHFVCMADESFDGESAARIIWQAGQDYRINPQMLIVLLQKEQGLVTDTFPNVNYQYAAATGYNCPDDGGGCRSVNAGFKTQVRMAASLFRTVLDGGWSNYPVGVNYVQYNPEASCGGTNVNILNRATSALYRYTPYQPNPGALAAGTGTAPCGAYGNRNFYNYFTDWFGSAFNIIFTQLDQPRWMEVKNNGVQKINVSTGEKVGEVFTAGRQIKFVDKVKLNGVWYLRTEFNHNDGGLFGIPQSEVQDIAYQDIPDKWITFKEEGNKSDAAARTSNGGKVPKGTSVKVVDQIVIDGNLYYRTELDKNNNKGIGIHSRFVTDFNPISLDGVRDFCSNTTINQINPQINTVVNSVPAGTYHISKKTLIDNVWYFQTTANEGSTTFFKQSDLLDACYVPLEGPRSMRITENVTRINPYTNERLDTIQKGKVVSFSTKIKLNNQWYFRTTHNTENNVDAVVQAAYIRD